MHGWEDSIPISPAWQASTGYFYPISSLISDWHIALKAVSEKEGTHSEPAINPPEGWVPRFEECAIAKTVEGNSAPHYPLSKRFLSHHFVGICEAEKHMQHSPLIHSRIYPMLGRFQSIELMSYIRTALNSLGSLNLGPLKRSNQSKPTRLFFHVSD